MPTLENNPPQIFSVWSDEIENRLDVFFYRPENQKIAEKLKDIKSVYFGDIMQSIINGLDCRQFEEYGNAVYLRVGNIKPYEINFDNAKRINILNDQIKKDIKLFRGDILLTRKGTFGVAVALNKDIDALISSEIFLIRLKAKNINPNFVEIFLNSDICQKQFNSQKVGAIMGSLSQGAVKKILIPIPPRTIQDAVVEKMQSARAQAKSKEAEAKNILAQIDDYVLGELGIVLPERGAQENNIFSIWSDEIQGRLDPFYYRVAFRNNLKKIKNGVALKQIASVFSGQRPKGGVRNIESGIPSLGGEHVLGSGEIESGDLKFIDEEFHKKHLKSKVFANDIILVKDGATTGKIGIIPPDYPYSDCNINEHVFAIRIKDNNFLPKFVFEFLYSSVGQLQLKQRITGATVTGLTKEMAENLLIPMLNIEIQKKIVARVKSMRRDAARLQKEAGEAVAAAQAEVEKMILG